jgi:hypothetical protein
LIARKKGGHIGKWGWWEGFSGLPKYKGGRKDALNCIWCKTTLHCPKVIVTNIVFQNNVFLDFHQVNIKRVSYKLYLK